MGQLEDQAGDAMGGGPGVFGRRAGSKGGLQKLLLECWGLGREDVRRQVLEDVALGSGLKFQPSLLSPPKTSVKTEVMFRDCFCSLIMHSHRITALCVERH